MIENHVLEDKKFLISSITITLQVFEYLALSKQEATVQEISNELSLPKNSVFKIIKSLQFYGYLEERQRKYRVTPRLLYLGYGGMQNNGIIENSLDVMYLLRKRVDETIMLGSLCGYEIVVLELLRSTQPIKFTTEIGQRISIHASAPGKVILAFLPEVEQERILDQIKYTRHTDVTIPSKKELKSELALIRKQGYAVDTGEESLEVHCVGAPIFDYRHYPIGSLWLSGPAYRITENIVNTIGSEVFNFSLMVSRRFGYNP